MSTVPLTAGENDDVMPMYVLVEVFLDPGCPECELINKYIMPELEMRYSEFSEMKEYDIGDRENFLLLAALQDKLDIRESHNVTMIINRRHVLGGYRGIKDSLFETIDLCLAMGESPPDISESVTDDELLSRRGEGIAVLAVIVAGLIDGLNPCVISALVFMMSVLALSRTKGRALLAVGCAYCLASFLTYLLLGLGIFRFIRMLSGFSHVGVIIDCLVFGVLIIFAAYSLTDAFRYWKSGCAGDISLKLPDSLSRLSRRVTRSGLGNHYLIPGVFIVGIVVTLLEAVCTGQIYLPTIALLVREGGVFSRWFPLLVLYNIMFILPLVGVFVLVYSGVSAPRLVEWSRCHVVPSKMIMAMLFLVLAILILYL